MKRFWALPLVLTFLATIITGNAHAYGRTIAAAGSNGPGLLSLTSCIASNQRVDVLVLMDESGSLSEGPSPTDPQAQRVVALKRLLDGLTPTNTSVEGSPVVSVELDGFSTDYDRVHDFQALTSATLPSFQSSSDLFAARSHGNGTNFVVALQGARSRLIAQAAAEGGRSCQAIVLFTDGVYDVGSSTGDVAGRAALCARGQAIDRLRTDGVTLIAVGLGDKPSTLLPALSGAGTCGTVTADSGLYVAASDVQALLSAFDLAGALIAGGTDLGTTSTAVRRFFLGADLSRALLLIRSPDSAQPLILRAPDGEAKRLDGQAASSFSIAGLAVSRTATSGGYFTATASANQAGTSAWAGQWSFESPAAANAAIVDIVLFPDLAPSLSAGVGAYLGQLNKIDVTLNRPAGSAASAAENLQPHRLRVSIIDPTRPDHPQTQNVTQHNGAFTFNFTPDANQSSTSVSAVMNLDSLAPDGSILTTVSKRTSISLKPPVTYPQVSPSKIDLGTIEGQKSASTTLTMQGGESAGCVSIGELVPLELPSGVKTLTSSPNVASCRPLTKNGRVQVEVSFKPTGVGDGRFSGILPVTLADSEGHSISLRIPVVAQFLTPVSQGRRLLLFLLLVFGGGLLPLLFMRCVAQVGARLRPLDSLRFVSLPVVLTRSGTPLLPSAMELRPIPPGAASAREIRVPDGALIRRQVPLNPFATPTAVASVHGRHVVASDGARRNGEHFVGLLPTRIGACWLFALEDATASADGVPTLRGTLTILVADVLGLPDPFLEACAAAKKDLVSTCEPLFRESEEEKQRSEEINAAGNLAHAPSISSNTDDENPFSFRPF